jgi:DNA-directed RNA polymerase specialized sigma24 family protein
MESSEALHTFLLWLGGDDASGARMYEDVRQKLVLLFRCRGCFPAEELADETIDRTARALLKPGFICDGQPIAYMRGVARNIYLEWLRKQRGAPVESISEPYLELPAPVQSTEGREVIYACLDRCLNALPQEKRSLLIRYYRNEKKSKIDDRQLMAEEVGVGLNALRIQVFRLRNTVRKCMERCQCKKEMESSNSSFNM